MACDSAFADFGLCGVNFHIQTLFFSSLIMKLNTVSEEEQLLRALGIACEQKRVFLLCKAACPDISGSILDE
jgi:hypothetical protein